MCWQQSRQQFTVILQYLYCEIILQFITVKMKYSIILFIFLIYSKILAAESPVSYCNLTVFVLWNYLAVYYRKNYIQYNSVSFKFTVNYWQQSRQQSTVILQ